MRALAQRQRHQSLYRRRFNLYGRSSGSGLTLSAVTAPTDGTLDPVNGVDQVILVTPTATGANRYVEYIMASSGEPFVMGSLPGQWVYSCYIKGGATPPFVLMRGIGPANADLWVNSATGAVGTFNSSNTASLEVLEAKSEDVGNGWYRISLRALWKSNTAQQNRVRIFSCNADASTNATLGQNFYVWGVLVQPFARKLEALLPNNYARYTRG